MHRIVALVAAVVMAGAPGFAHAASEPGAPVRVVQAELTLTPDLQCGILDNRGRVWCAGEAPDTTRIAIPQPVKRVAGNCALTAGGKVWCWRVETGHNGAACGPGNDQWHYCTLAKAWRVRLPERIRQINSRCGLGVSGRLWCWGGTAAAGEVVRMPLDERLASLSQGSCGLSRAHHVWCWTPGDGEAPSPPTRVADKTFSSVVADDWVDEGVVAWCAVPRKGRGLVCDSDLSWAEPVVVQSLRLTGLQVRAGYSGSGTEACGIARGRVYCINPSAPVASEVADLRGVTRMVLPDPLSYLEDPWPGLCVTTRDGDLVCDARSSEGSPLTWQRGGAGRLLGVVFERQVWDSRGLVAVPCSLMGSKTIACWQGPGDSKPLPAPWLAEERSAP